MSDPIIADLLRRIEALESRDVFVDVDTAAELTIATGAVTVPTLRWPSVRYRILDTEGDAATDDLDTINGGVTGDILILASSSASRDPTIKDGTGNLNTAGDFTLSSTVDTITLLRSGSIWLEIARSNNG